MKYKFIIGIVSFLLISNIICLDVSIDLTFEYPYTCGTWFNRGKNTCNAIKEKLEQNGMKVASSIKSFHVGETHEGYNGEFNIYMNKDGNKILLATSLEGSKYFHSGLKYFAYTFFKTDQKNGERVYYEEFPQKKELLEYMLKRTVESLKANNLK